MFFFCFFTDIIRHVPDILEHGLPVQRDQPVLPDEREGDGERDARPNRHVPHAIARRQERHSEEAHRSHSGWRIYFDLQSLPERPWSSG